MVQGGGGRRRVTAAGGDGARVPTVYDVARSAGVSIATVSRVLSGADPVRPATRDRVMGAVRELGYVPSGSARGLAARSTGAVGLLLPGHDLLEEPVRPVDDGPHAPTFVDETSAAGRRAAVSGGASRERYYDAVLRGAETEAWRSGRALMVAAGRGASRDVVAHDVAGRVDGLVVVASTVSEDLLGHVARRVPVVVLADSHPHGIADRVVADNEGGIRALVEHACRVHGVRSAVHVQGPDDSPDDAERRRGVAGALAAAGVRDVRRLPGDFGSASGRAAASALLAAGPLPDLVVCSNDQMALGVLEVFAERGVRVPGDVLVTGFDGIEASAVSTPPLTTVRQPMERLGAVAVRLLLERLGERDAERGAGARSVVLPVEVVLRESCPPEPVR